MQTVPPPWPSALSLFVFGSTHPVCASPPCCAVLDEPCFHPYRVWPFPSTPRCGPPMPSLFEHDQDPAPGSGTQKVVGYVLGDEGGHRFGHSCWAFNQIFQWQKNKCEDAHRSSSDSPSSAFLLAVGRMEDDVTLDTLDDYKMVNEHSQHWD